MHNVNPQQSETTLVIKKKKDAGFYKAGKGARGERLESHAKPITKEERST